MAKKLFVGNPRNIPKGTHILRMADGKMYYEGDEFKKPSGMKAKDVQDLKDRGFLVELSDG